MSNLKYCNELLETLNIMEKGLLTPLESISGKSLNYVFAENKMTIGQIAVHCGAWPEYFMTDKPSWEPVKWTCRFVDYPLTLDIVKGIISVGFNSIRNKLKLIDDQLLEIDEKGNKGPGYIICRLMLHTMVHSNQMAYLRQIIDPEWSDRGMFGKMAAAYIKLSYFTERDKNVFGF
ncbi:MAG: hypothetical protein HeimC3_06750 [Candidatus Heimdallarchaeota archaeon LC_3]|nr:MAG: hypothetical protein HeimC3_06750 [Candidatus Heimdallarchaeota archaeon LC_3]